MQSRDRERELESGRRHFLKCMAWVGTGAVWTLAGGTLKGSALGQAASQMAAMSHGGDALRFVQISHSHIGFDKPANTDGTATLRAAIAGIKAEPGPPAFMTFHTAITSTSARSIPG